MTVINNPDLRYTFWILGLVRAVFINVLCNLESKDQDDIVMAEFSESRKRFTHVSEQKIDEHWQTMTVKLNFRSLETSSPEPEADPVHPQIPPALIRTFQRPPPL